MRGAIKVAETEYYKKLNGVYGDVKGWFFNKPMSDSTT